MVFEQLRLHSVPSSWVVIRPHTGSDAHLHAQISQYPLASCQIVVNAGIGIVGYALYCLNATIGGLPSSNCAHAGFQNCVDHCENAYRLLLILQSCRPCVSSAGTCKHGYRRSSSPRSEASMGVSHHVLHRPHDQSRLLPRHAYHGHRASIPSDGSSATVLFMIVAQSSSWAWMSHYFVAKSQLCRRS